MTETKKEGRGKGELIALAVLVVILGVSNIWIYTNLQNQVDALNNEKKNLERDVDTLQSQHDTLNTAYQNLQSAHNNYVANHHHTDSEYNTLKSERDSLNDIVNLEKYTTLIYRRTINQPAGYYTYWTFSVNYAGYISVNVHTSTTTNTYVEVVYSSYGVSFDQKITVGTSGEAVFPALPSSDIQVRVGNTNWASGATETVTVTYCY